MIQIDKQAVYKYHGYVFQHFSILSEELLKQILDWRNTFEIRQFMYNTDVISLENHLNFTKTLAQREDCYYWLVTKDNVPYGVFNLTNIDHERRIAELGYYMAPSQMKSGGGLDFVYTLNPQLHSRSATYIKRNGLLIRKITIKSSRPFQCAYHPLTP